MSTAIEFNNISKLYRLGLVSSGTLSNDLKRWWTMNILHKEDPFMKVGSVNDRSKAADSEYVWALKDIDFKVEQGDVVGIIGKNGAGKSTLLKLLSRVTGPTTGTIKAKGRIASLLEVGTGFHSELTGRENIYMNGTILGMTKHEIDKKIDEIIDFSGCERYIDTPVKRYSSGMTVRLGFAVAAHLDPEILVVDEVLAVGDAEFQKKAIGKMKDISQGKGRTVLFVSHNMGSIKALCNHGVLLKNGMVQMIGEIYDVVDTYMAESYDKDMANVWDISQIDEKKDLQIIHAELKDADGKLKTSFSCDEDIFLEMTFYCKKRVPGVYGYFNLVKASDGTEVLVSDSNDVIYNKLESLPVGESKVLLHFPKRMLAPGTYLAGVNINSNFDAGGLYIQSLMPFLKFETHDFTTERGDQRNGFFSTIIDWEFV